MRYGYRRVTLTLKKLGFIINHKKVLRIMRENNLLCTKFTRRSRSLKTYKGQIGKVAKNMLNRRFKTDRPLQKLVSDWLCFQNAKKLTETMVVHNSI